MVILWSDLAFKKSCEIFMMEARYALFILFLVDGIKYLDVCNNSPVHKDLNEHAQMSL